MAVSIQTLTNQLSFAMSLNPLFPSPSIAAAKPPAPAPVIRMGGGPRTFPGGVSKWQWKRMQAKKAKQLLKARLCRERQIYEMRKRAELRAAASELERPWEAVSAAAAAAAPALLSVSADEQLKVLADRFHRPGGFDMWTSDDGPQLFPSPADELPSARFFPKGAVHSVKPYRRQPPIADSEDASGEDDPRTDRRNLPLDSEASSSRRSYESRFGSRLEPNVGASDSPRSGGRRKQPTGRSGQAKLSGNHGPSDSKSSNSFRRRSGRGGGGGGGHGTKWSGNPENRGFNGGSRRENDSRSEVYDMGLQQDGSYGFQ